jgi:hypothetical protein
MFSIRYKHFWLPPKVAVDDFVAVGFLKDQHVGSTRRRPVGLGRRDRRFKSSPLPFGVGKGGFFLLDEILPGIYNLVNKDSSLVPEPWFVAHRSNYT